MTDAPLNSRLRVWLLTNAPSPYQLEFFKTLGQQPGIELSVRFMREAFRGEPVDTAAIGLSARVYRGLGAPGGRDELRLHLGALREIFFQRHDVYVLSGLYTSPTVLLSALCLAACRGRYLLWLERPSERKRGDLPRWKQWLRAPIVAARFIMLRLLFAGAWRVVCIGSRAAQQYQEIGLSKGKTAVVPYCCNAQRFEIPDANRVAEFKNKWGLGDRFVFLFSGQLIHRKGVDNLIEAYRNVASQRANTALLILGDGPLRDQLVQEAGAIPQRHGHIVLAGHQSQVDMPHCFACADVFVFPSRHDGWGVVLNEACAAGLPIIASLQTGAAYDLICEQQNGFRVEAEDIDMLVRHMLFLLDHPDEVSKFRKKSLELSRLGSVDHGAREFARIVREVGRA